MKKEFLKLHILLLLYSMTTIFSKIAGTSRFFSFKFFLCYGLIILLLGIYAIFWQQIIKKMPLTYAYSNKSITVLWGLIWGVLLFDEKITVSKIIGCLLVISGIVLFSFSNHKKEEGKIDDK